MTAVTQITLPSSARVRSGVIAKVMNVAALLNGPPPATTEAGNCRSSPSRADRSREPPSRGLVWPPPSRYLCVATCKHPASGSQTSDRSAHDHCKWLWDTNPQSLQTEPRLIANGIANIRSVRTLIATQRWEAIPTSGFVILPLWSNDWPPSCKEIRRYDLKLYLDRITDFLA